MVGGTVVEVLVGRDRVWINCENTHHRGSYCAIYVEKTAAALNVKKGDSLWWQGRNAMWTPQDRELPEECSHREHITCQLVCGRDYDITIPRIGNSGADHPAQAMIESAYASA